jgi:aminoglycoside phosphotransferase (APT) family kinase protein
MRERLLMLSEPAGERLRQAGLMQFGFASGWERFHASAPPPASALVRYLHDKPEPLLNQLAKLPQTLLHNDIKTANLALEGDTLWLFDWALAGYGPVGCELGWLLSVNSSRLPWPLDETAERYRERLRRELAAPFDDAAWKAQLAVAHITGLKMFGWGKDGDELAWWCERAIEAAALLGLRDVAGA